MLRTDTSIELGIIPTTSVMYNPQILDTRSRASIINALIDMNYDMYLENYSSGNGDIHWLL